MVQGKTLGIDATTLEANAAMRAIVRRDTGEDYNAFLTRLAQASGIETPTAEELARFDRKRKKKMSNEEWTHPHDPDSKIAKMKDGSTHMAHKVEHAVDLGTGAVVGLTLQGAEKGDTETVVETAITAAEQVEAVLPEGSGVAEMVGDKGYHSNETLVGLAAVGVRSYISEPDRGRRSWEDHPEARDPVYGNRRRIRGKRGRRLLRSRGERVERTFAHAYETGGMRRVHLRGHPNILKRLLVHVGGTQPRAASAPPDRGRHAPEPAGAGSFRHLRSARASDRPLGASDGFLGRQSAAGGYRRLTRSSPSRLNGPDRGRTSSTGCYTSFAVDDVKAEHERLVARGVRFVQPPTDLGPVITAVFDDSCGNLIQIAEEKPQP